MKKNNGVNLVLENGKTAKLGSRVNFSGEKCVIYDISYFSAGPRHGEIDIGIESLSSGISWVVEPKAVGIKVI